MACHASGSARGLARFVGCALLLGFAVRSVGADTVTENFATDPVAGGRFIQSTGATQSIFTYNAAAQNLSVFADLDFTTAYYLSNPFSAFLTQTMDSGFSVVFSVESFLPDTVVGLMPQVTLGLMNTTGVDDFGSGLTAHSYVDLSGNLFVRSRIDSIAGPEYFGPSIALAFATRYLAVGSYSSATRKLTLSVFGGPGLNVPVGTSVSVALPGPASFAVGRIGIQNKNGNNDAAVGGMFLTVDDLSTPAAPPGAAPVPEPATLGLLAGAFASLVTAARRRRREGRGSTR